MLDESAPLVEDLPADLADVQDRLEVLGDVLEDEVLLVVDSVADGAGVVLLTVHVQVPLARGQGRELQPALPAPRVARRAVISLVKD